MLLLDAVVALAVLVGFGGVILATLSDAREQLDFARRRVLAQDLATSAVAELAAGLRQAEEMSGPVKDSAERGGSGAGGGGGAAFDDAPRQAGGWELAVETTAGGYEGLTLVSVTAREAGLVHGASFTLRRLIATRVGPNSAGRVSGAGDEGGSR